MDMKELDGHAEDAMFEVGGQMMSKGDLRARLTKEMDDTRVSVVAQRDEWVRYRASSGIEERWRRANALYHGEEFVQTQFVETLQTGPAARQAKQEEANRSKVVINIVRPKVDQAIARMCEILLPTDDKNWGINCTPVPDNVKAMLGDQRETVRGDTGAPTGMTADAEAQKYVADCKAKVEKMEDTIDDQLTECKYNAEQRSMISDGVRLGTGIMLGPFPAKQTSKAWLPGEGGKMTMQVNSKTVPASIHADPWDVWFDPACGADHQNGAGYWHKRMVTRKQVRALRGVLGFDEAALRIVLEQAPTRVSTAEGRVRKTNAIKEQAYELWTYHGEVEPDQMRMMTSNTGDPLEVDFAVVMMINDHVVGAMKSWIVDKTLPCDVWCWRKADDMPQGFALGNELEHQQRVVTSAWRQVMDNGRFCVGPQLVFLDGVEPTNGKREITPGKLWTADPNKVGNDANKAMASISFDGHLTELLAIAEKAMEFADMESSMPQIIGGEQGSAPETVGGTVMLYNNAQAVLRMRVKLYDDEVTNPHIGRYYDWNMANNPDPNIKGDMEVDARGSTALLEKDIQNQATLNLANVTSNPRYAAYLDPQAELKVILKAFKVQPETIMATDDQIKKNLSQPAPPDPRLVAAQMALRAKQMDLADRDKQRAADQARDAQVAQERGEDREYNKQREQAEYEIAQTHEMNTRDLQEQRLAQEERITAAELETNTGIKHLEIDTKRQIFNAEAALRVRTGQGI